MRSPGEILLHIGPLAIHWYGFLIVLGAAAGGLVAGRLARARGDDPAHVWNMLAVALVLGIIGARLYHVFSTPAAGVGWWYYRQHPEAIFAFWRGGLRGFGIYGGIAGGILGIWLYTRWAKLPFLRWLDYAAPGVLLAQAIGRWGNFFNQELYGPPTNLPWGVYIDPAHRLPGLETYERFHPVFLYESLANFAAFLLLLWWSRRGGRRDGDVFLAYFILYPFIRFWLEFLRPDAWKVAGVATAQWISLACMVGAGITLWLRHRRPKTHTTQ
jgi:phosphatidylglycerol:prolipoprotein diacylglycerol transferase